MIERKDSCLTCRLNEKPNEDLGGVVWEDDKWRVEHAVGPVTEGTMVVKSKQHSEWLYDLMQAEILELGPIFAKVTKAIKEVTNADRVYISMWAEQSRHVHFVLKPVTRELVDSFGGLKASRLQAAMAKKNRPIKAGKAKELSQQIKQKLQEIESVEVGSL